MNPAAPGAPPQGQPAPGQQNAQQPQQQSQRPPMYQPAHIRNLPHLTEDEKKKYEQGLRSLWTRANTSAQGSQEQNAARQKIIDFSRMLITKIQGRRTALQQQQQDQQAQAGQTNAQGQQPQAAQQPQQPQPQAPQQQQQQPQAQAQQPQPQQQQQQPPQSQPQQQQSQPQQQQQQQQQAQPQTQAQAQAQGIARPPSAQQTATLQAPTPGAAPTPQQQQHQPAAIAGVPVQAGAAATNAAPGQVQKPKISDQLLQFVNKMVFRPPHHIAEKSTAEAAKWIEEMRERYARALMTMESSKKKLAGMEQWFNERKQQGNPLKDDELRTYQVRKEQQLKLYTEAHKWVEGIRKQQGIIQGAGQANQNAAGAAPAAQQNTDNSQPASNAGPVNNQNTATGVPGPMNAATEAARQQALAGNRASPANGVSTPTQPPQPRPTPSVNQPAVQPVQTQPPVQPQHQAQPPSQGQPLPPPVNTALASAAAAAAQNQATGTPTQAGARVQTPQSATPVTAGGPTRALSHSAAMSLANQRAVNTPGSAPVPGQQPSGGTPTPTGGAVPQSSMAPNALPQQGHPHAHPSQSQQTIQSKMPIPKHLPERATSVPQGVTMGGGVNAGRPTMSQGGGTLGGVMNQPAVPKIPAYSHEAEGDHVLSKKKLDELVRQVCGGAGEGQEGNLLTPEVEENVLNMADSFVDNVLHAACRNAKERGSKVLEIRDIQLILERTYNIRVPGYSSDELRTVRKVQPSSGWIAKMSAVQAAKVMPGKTD